MYDIPMGAMLRREERGHVADGILVEDQSALRSGPGAKDTLAEEEKMRVHVV